MKKDFKSWHDEKSEIHDNKTRPFFNEREVWFGSVGLNVGFEEDGKGEEFLRPLLVFKKFNNESFWAIPVTRRMKSGKYYFPFEIESRGLNNLILSQLRMMDAKRLKYKIGTMSNGDYKELKQKLKLLFA